MASIGPRRGRISSWTLPENRRRISIFTKNCRVPQLSQLLLLLPLSSSSPFRFPASLAMAKAADKKADKKSKASAPSKKAAAASPAKAASKPLSSKEILAMAKKQVRISTRICKGSCINYAQDKKSKAKGKKAESSSEEEESDSDSESEDEKPKAKATNGAVRYVVPYSPSLVDMPFLQAKKAAKKAKESSSEASDSDSDSESDSPVTNGKVC